MLNEYIVVIPNALPEHVCDAILTEYQASTDWEPAMTRGGVDTSFRNVSVVSISHDWVIQRNTALRKQLANEVYASAFSAINEYVKRFPYCNISHDSGYDLLRYETGQFYKEHCDAFTEEPRTVSCSFALNDDFHGGEFSFFEGTQTYKQPKGSALLFPSTFLFPHQVMPVRSGTRYSIVTWFN